MQSDLSPSRKDLSLEALRGCAAWAVVGHHFIGAFRPGWNGFPMLTQWNGMQLVGTPLYALINGRAAVMLFFVLSGYVLTLRFFMTRDVHAVGLAMIKRWPRLAGPAVLATVSSTILWFAGCYYHREAAALTSSIWLRDFATTRPWAPWTPSLAGAIAQGSFLTFFVGDDWYNSNLWTMRYELLGSYLSWAVAIILVFAVKGRGIWFLLGILAVLMNYCSPLMNGFIAGVILGKKLGSLSRIIHRRWAPLFFFAAVLMLSIREPSFEITPIRETSLFQVGRCYMHILASVILIILFSQQGPWNNIFNNRFGQWMGHMSFAVYLTHPLIILSASSWAYIVFYRMWGENLAIGGTAIATIILVLAFSTPLAAFDVWWTRLIGKLALNLIAVRKTSVVG